jgi:hypothetical protein
MDPTLENEVFFLVARLLRSSFPDVAEQFIQQCQLQRRFPVSSPNPSFEHLTDTAFDGILGLSVGDTYPAVWRIENCRPKNGRSRSPVVASSGTDFHSLQKMQLSMGEAPTATFCCLFRSRWTNWTP